MTDQETGSTGSDERTTSEDLVLGLRTAVRALESLASQHQGRLRGLGPERCDCVQCAYARMVASDLRVILRKVGVLKIDADECELCGQKYCDGSDHIFSDAEAEVAYTSGTRARRRRG